MRILAAILTVIALGACLAQEQGKAPATFTLDDVLKLVRAGIAEDVLIARIKRFNKPFDLNSDEILELKKDGVSDTVIKYLLEPTLPYPSAPPPAPVPPPEVKPAVAPPKDPLMAKLPPEPGMFWLSKADRGSEAFEVIEVKPVVPLKSAGGGGKIAKMLPIKKGHNVGFLVSSASKLRTPPGAQVFYARLGAKIAIEDIVLLQMTAEDNRRVLDFGPKPDAPVPPPNAMRSFEPKFVVEGLYRIDVPALRPGEYLFWVRGSGDPKKGILGKGYDFGVGKP